MKNSAIFLVFSSLASFGCQHSLEPGDENHERIVFISDRDGNREIYSMDYNGSNQRNLSKNAEEDKLPVFSPDGAKIAFVSRRDGNSEIYIMNVDGSRQQRLTNHPAGDTTPQFTPDDSRIVFVSHVGLRDREIAVIDIEGTNRTTIAAGHLHTPRISPDGSKIAYEAFAASDSAEAGGNHEIYIMDRDGENQTRLTNNESGDFLGHFSPDGSKIIFSSERDGGMQVYIMNIDGSNQTNLTNSSYYDINPYFSPDGLKITFERDIGTPQDLYIMDLDGSNKINLTKSEFRNGEGKFFPNGEQILFVSKRNSDTEIFKMNIDGTQLTNLTNNPGNDVSAIFQPK